MCVLLYIWSGYETKPSRLLDIVVIIIIITSTIVNTTNDRSERMLTLNEVCVMLEFFQHLAPESTAS